MKHPILATLALLVPMATMAQTNIEKIQNALWSEREIAEGVVWKYYFFDDLFGGPQHVHVTSLDMSVPGNTIRVNWRPGDSRATVPQMALDYPNTVVGLNGNFFNTSSPFNSLQHTRTEGVVRYPSVVGAHDEGAVVVDNSDQADTVLRPGSGNWNDRPEPHIIASNVPFWDNGVKYTLPTTNFYNVDRHPRTAVGKTGDNKFLFVIVEGRRPDAAGMTLIQMQDLFEGLGATDGLNMDGGGSSTMWVKDQPGNGVVNVLSDGFLRQIPTGLSMISTGPPTIAPWDADLNTVTASPLTRTGEAYTVTASYTNRGTETWTTSNVSIVPSRAFGRTSAFIPAGQESTFFQMSPASVAPGQTATFTLNFTPPTVATDTLYIEHFALSHNTEGWFGPADNRLSFSVTVRPEMVGAPPTRIIQGTPVGVNNQWYVENTAGWGASSVGFTAAGVNDSGSQRFCGSSTLNRSASFRPVFDVAGTYSIEVAWPPSTNSINNVQYSISHLNGTSNFTINQHQTGSSMASNTWHKLGDFEFGTGETKSLGTHAITVSNPAAPTNGGNRFYSGAVRIDWIGPLASTGDWELFD